MMKERDAATVGVVRAISSKAIEVSVVPEAPHGTGLRGGVMQSFPRVNSYIVLPTEKGSLLAIVVRVEMDADPKITHRSTSDEIKLPIPRRRLDAIPLGVIVYKQSGNATKNQSARLDRGALVFPTVGDPVRLPTSTEISAALLNIDNGFGITVGSAPLVSDAEVRLNPNRLFGRHLAVLGNTGSGKSCSVVQLVRASATAISKPPKNFNVIVLDLNGEYANAFDGLDPSIRIRRFSAQRANTDVTGNDVEQFRLPYWLFNYCEWVSFTGASSQAQAPQLRRCLQILRHPDYKNSSMTGNESLVELSEGGAIGDSPIPFHETEIPEVLGKICQNANGKWITTLTERLRIAFSDERQTAICGWKDGENIEDWLQKFLPDNGANQITVIDLSLVSSHILHMIVAVFARVIQESMERMHRQTNGETIPRILVAEEAHTLLSRRRTEATGNETTSPTHLCREAFERIAREGRKFGISLIVSSQRPSELSTTVISQCNTFLIHRVVNPSDQTLVKRLVPDRLETLMDELPALPTQVAIAVGWAIDTPLLVRMSDLDKNYQPRSADPDFVGTWQGDRQIAARWQDIIEDWTQPLPKSQPATTDSSYGNAHPFHDTAQQEKDDDPF